MPYDDSFKIEYDSLPGDLQFLDDRIYEFNCEQTGIEDGRLFSIFLRGAENEILAGLSGWTWAQACEIRILWIHSTLRGQGYGRRLMEMAEQEARSRGCKVIYLNSYSFQAPEFYRKLGFEVFARLDDFPPGHYHDHLVKRLAD
jgi:GNAT superfamily N-acetyltransferase